MSAAFLAVCVCILVGLSVSDDSTADSTVVVDGVTYMLRTAGYAEVGDGTNPAVDDSRTFVQIPATVQGVTVEKINSNAFNGLTELQSVTFGSSVTEIRDNAFYECTGLCYVPLGNVTSVGSYSFYHCTSMIVADVSNMGTISSHAFEGCTSLANITLNSAANIDQYAFHGCTNLSYIQGNFKNIRFGTGWEQFTGCHSRLVVNNNGNGDGQDYKNNINNIFGGNFGGKTRVPKNSYYVLSNGQFNATASTNLRTLTLNPVDSGALPSAVNILIYMNATYNLPAASGIYLNNEFASTYWSATNPGTTEAPSSVTMSSNLELYRMCVPVKPTITDSTITQKYDGQNVVLTAESDTIGVTWQWYKGGVAISGATGSTLVLKDVEDSGSYSVRTAYRTILGEMSASSTVTISPRDVVLTSDSGSKTYDGTALTNSTVNVSGDGFADGEGASYSVTGTQTNAGNSLNSFTYSLNPGTKASNYNISTSAGTLVVNRAPMSISITSSKTYDSAVFTYSIKSGDVTGMVTGDTLEAGAISTTGMIAMTYSVETTHWSVSTPVSTSNGISNYDVSYTVSLTIDKRDISVRSDDATKVFDGSALTKTTYTISSGSLAGSDTIISVTVTGSITNVSESGTGNNTITGVVINNTGGTNVSTSYNITFVAGNLSITPKSAVVTISTDKVYDGTAFSYNILTSNVTGLVTGDAVTAGTLTTTSADVKVYSAQTVDWNITAALTTSKGVGNYSVEYTVSLEITKRTVTLTSGDASKPYDGSPLTNTNVTVTGDGFVTGEGATYSVTGTQTSVGSSSNTFTYTLNSGTLAGNYTIETVFGTLTITAGNTITITVTNASKVYDGTPLTSEAFTFSGNLVAGDELVITTSGSQTVVGSSANAVSTVKVMRGDVDVTSNYTFGTHISGTLTVSKAPLKVTVNSSKPYDAGVMVYTILGSDVSGLVDGDSLTGGAISTTSVFAATYTAQTSDWTVSTAISTTKGISNYDVTYKVSLEITKRDITIRSDDATKVYDGTPLTKGTYSISEGSLAGTDVIFTVTISGSITAVSQSGTANNTITAAVINSSAGVNVSSSYNIKLVAGDLSITPKTLNITVSDSKMYDGTVLSFTVTTAQADGLVAGDAVTAGAVKTVSANVKAYTVRDTDWTITTDLATSNGIGNYSVIYTISLEITKRDVVLTSASGSKAYDGTALTNSTVNVTGSGFVTGEGADFTVTGTQTEPGTSDNTFTYTLKAGTLAGNYQISVVLGKLTVTTGNAITITVTNASKVYDGTPLTSDLFTYTGTLVEGDQIQITTGGTQTVVGSSANAILTVKIMRGQTDVTANYTMGSHVAGTLTVTRAPLSVTITQTKTYDAAVFSYAAVPGDVSGLVEGDYITAGAVASNSAIAGKYSAVNTQWTVTTAFATANGISNYDVTYDVSLEITKRDITIRSDDATKVYDGTALSKNTFAVSAGSLAGSDSIFSATITGSITNVAQSGTANNTITAAVINNAVGTNVSSSYNITLVAGDLSITPKALNIAVDVDKMYDGTALASPIETSNASGLVPGDAVTAGAIATVSANVKNYTVKDTDWIITSPVSTSNGAGNYSIVYTVSLEITKRDVTLTSANGTKAYDGSPLTNNTVNVTGSGFISGEGADFTVTGTQTEPGTSDNTFTYTLKAGTLAGNYQITVVFGKLTITSGDTITVIVTDARKVFDGTALTSDAFTFTGVLVDGDKIVITTSGTQTDVGTSSNAVSTVKIMRGDVDVTSNYTMGIHVAGTLTVTKAALTIEVHQSKTYDAKVFDYGILSADVSGLVQGDSLKTGSIVSSSAVAGIYKVQASGWHIGDAVTTLKGISNYDVTYDVSLEITKRDITIRSDDATKVYDGTPLIKRTCSVSVGSLAVGDSIGSAVISGIITDVSESGTGNNTLTSVIINSSESNNVTSSYNITLVSGDLSVTERSLTIEVVSYANGYYATKLYDGTKLSYNVTNKNVTGLVDGDDIIAGTLMTVSAKAGSYLVRDVDWTVTVPIATTNGIGNYSVRYNVSMEIESRTVVITSDSDSKVYDAAPLEKHTVTVTEDGFIAGEGATYTFTGSQTKAGQSENRFTYALNDGTDAGNYIIIVNFGTLTVSKASMITVTLTNQSKVYDGTPLTSDAFTYSGMLVNGHQIVITASGSQTSVGAGSNVLTSVRIMDGAADVTENYNLGTHNNGTLTVTHAPLSIRVSSQKIYDGTAFMYAFKASDLDGLVKGDVLTGGIVTTVNGTAGKYDAEITGWKVTAPLSTFNGVSNYAVSYDVSLEITKRDITIRSDDATKVYDGSPLTKATYSISSGSLASGDSVYSVMITGSITNVAQSGTGNNTVTSARIINAGSTNVSDCYNITYVAGTLTIQKRTLTVTANGSSVTYGDAVPVLSVDSGKGWASGESYATGGMTATDVAAYLVTAYTPLSPAGTPVPITWNQSAAADLGSAFGNYSVNLIGSTIDVGKKALTVNVEVHKAYDGSTYVYSILEEKDVFGLVKGDSVFAGQITSRSANAGTYSGNTDWFFSVPLETVNGIGNYQVTTHVSMVIEKKLLTLQNGADPIAKMYDGTDVGVTLTKGVHYILSGAVDGDSVDFVSSANRFNSAHVAGANKVTITSIALSNPNYTISSDSLSASISKRDVVLTSESYSKVYDGTPLTDQKVTISGSMFAPGEGVSFNVTGTQTSVGCSDNTFTYSLLSGTEVTDYDIRTIYGVLTVTTGTDIVITVLDADKTYDGTALVSDAFEFSGILVKGNKIVITTDGTQTVVGSSVNKVTSVTIYDAYNNDVTSNYTFGTHIAGMLTVNPKNIVVKFGETGTYDGSVHSHKVLPSEVSELVAGDSITAGIMATATADAGTFTAVGTGVVFTEALATANGIGNYAVTYDVSFAISPREVTVSNGAAAITKVYDGTVEGIALVAGSNYVFSNVVDGDSVDFVSSACVFDSPYVGTVSSVMILSTGLDNSNYTVGPVTLDASITPREITIRSDDHSKIYDGTPLTYGEYTLTEGTLAPTDRISSTVIVGSITNVSESGTGNNTITAATIKNKEFVDVTANYHIVFVSGDLTVTHAPLSIKVSSQKTYDGTSFVYQITTANASGLASNDLVTVGTGTVATTGVDAADYRAFGSQWVFQTDLQTTNGIGNYSVSYNVSLEITKRTVILTSASASKAYDSTPLTNDYVAVTGDGFATGEGVTCTVTGSQTYEGSSPNYFTYVFNDGTLASNYSVTKVEGTLTVYISNIITVILIDVQKVYDGTPLSSDAYRYTGVLNFGDQIIITSEGSQTAVGQSDNRITSVKIMHGTIDVTSSYTLAEPVNGKITIIPAPLVVEIGSSKMYNSEALGYTVLAEDVSGLVAGDRLTQGSVMTASVLAGVYSEYGTEWVFGDALQTANGIENYDVRYTVALEITKRPVTFASASDEKYYDGTPLENRKVSVGGFGLAGNDAVAFSMFRSITEPGMISNTFEYAFGDSEYANSYAVNLSYGTLTVSLSPTVIIVFDSNGGSAVPSIEVDRYSVIFAPESPIRAGHQFSGWYDDAGLNHLYDFSSQVKTGFTLYAGWVVLEDVIPVSPSDVVNKDQKAFRIGIQPFAVEMNFIDFAKDGKVLAEGIDYTVGTGTVMISGSLISSLPAGKILITVRDGAGNTEEKVMIVPHVILSGNGERVRTDSEDLIIRTNCDLNVFGGLTVDGKTVDPSYYVLSEGSTVITLSSGFLKNLKNGDHDFEVISSCANVAVAAGYFEYRGASEPGIFDFLVNGDVTKFPVFYMSLMLIAFSIGYMAVFSRSGKR